MARESHHADLYGHYTDAQAALILADAMLAHAAATALSSAADARAWTDAASTRLSG
jgi:hypothetical protein